MDRINEAHDAETMDTPFAFLFARSGARRVLIDSGLMREGRGVEMSERFGIAEWISPLRLLAELGGGPADVTDIVVSHPHLDHMGSIHKFPGPDPLSKEASCCPGTRR